MRHVPLLTVVLGPTGSGKSDLALTLAENFGGELVNCDSIQLYRHMEIGSARTPVAERRGIPHHMFDFLPPDRYYTAGDYARSAGTVIAEISARGHMPVLTGGTGFYLKALLEGLSEGPGRDEALRERLARRSSASLHRVLLRFDPASAKRIHPNDTKKLIRALEICILSRRPMTTLFESSPVNRLEGFQILKIGLDPTRDALATRLDARVVRMFEAGLLEEVRSILALGYPRDAKALESIGYKEAVLHLQGELSLEEAIVRAQAATRQYAKRQRTWFRRETDVHWLRAFGDSPEARAQALDILGRFVTDSAAK